MTEEQKAKTSYRRECTTCGEEEYAQYVSPEGKVVAFWHDCKCDRDADAMEKEKEMKNT